MSKDYYKTLGIDKSATADQIKSFTALIPHFAEGADVYSPTIALIGEAGPERVQPLSRSRDESAGGTQTNTIYLTVNIGNISSEMDLEQAKNVILGAVIKGVGKRK